MFNFIIKYYHNLAWINQYLNILNKTKYVYHRKFTHKVYLNLANEMLKEMRY